MDAADELVGNGKHDNSRYCFAKPNDSYLVYLPDGGAATLDLTNAAGQYTVEWFDPRSGGPLRRGTIPGVNGGAEADLGMPPDSPGEDWLVLVRRR